MSISSSTSRSVGSWPSSSMKYGNRNKLRRVKGCQNTQMERAVNPPRYTTEREKQEPLGHTFIGKSTIPTLTLLPSPQDAPRVRPNGLYFFRACHGPRLAGRHGIGLGQRPAQPIIFKFDGPRPARQILIWWAAPRPGPSIFQRMSRDPAQPITLSKTRCPARPGPAHQLFSSFVPAWPITWAARPMKCGLYGPTRGFDWPAHVLSLY